MLHDALVAPLVGVTGLVLGRLLPGQPWWWWVRVGLVVTATLALIAVSLVVRPHPGPCPCLSAAVRPGRPRGFRADVPGPAR